MQPSIAFHQMLSKHRYELVIGAGKGIILNLIQINPAKIHRSGQRHIPGQPLAAIDIHLNLEVGIELSELEPNP